jgi:O-antigen/teichoic acid export membrane protein
MKDISAFLFSSIVEKVLSFLITLYCIRILSKEDYATFGIIFVSIGFIGMVLDMGHNGWLRSVFIKETNNFRFALKDTITTGFVLFIFFFTPLLYNFGYLLDLKLEHYFLIFIFVICNYFESLICGLFVTMQRAVTFFKFKILSCTINFILFFFLINFTSNLGPLSVRLIASLVGFFITLLVIKNIFNVDEIKARESYPLVGFEKRIKITFPIFIHGVAINGVLFFDRWIIDISENKHLLAEILVVFSIIGPVSMIGDVLGQKYISTFMLYMKNKQFDKLLKESLKLYATVLLICFIFYTFGFYILVYLTGIKYDTKEVMILLSWLSFYPFFKLFYQFQVRKFVFYEKVFRMAIITLFVTIGYLCLLIYYSKIMSADIYGPLFICYVSLVGISLWIAGYKVEKVVH